MDVIQVDGASGLGSAQRHRCRSVQRSFVARSSHNSPTSWGRYGISLNLKAFTASSRDSYRRQRASVCHKACSQDVLDGVRHMSSEFGIRTHTTSHSHSAGAECSTTNARIDSAASERSAISLNVTAYDGTHMNVGICTRLCMLTCSTDSPLGSTSFTVNV